MTDDNRLHHDIEWTRSGHRRQETWTLYANDSPTGRTVYHRLDGPAVIKYYAGCIVFEAWYLFGVLHRIDGPAELRYKTTRCYGSYSQGYCYERIWFHHGKEGFVDRYNRFNGEDYINTRSIWMETYGKHVSYNSNGTIYGECWSSTGTRGHYWSRTTKHRLDGPADITYHGNGKIHTISWCYDNRLHRLDGPAFVEYDERGDIAEEQWRIHGEFFRADGPSHIEYYDGKVLTEMWKFGYILHRTDGPAFVKYFHDGEYFYDEWWDTGVKIDDIVELEKYIALSFEDHVEIKLAFG